MPTAQDLLNRGNNLFPIVIVGAIALGGAPEIPGEGIPRGALDEALIIVIAAAGLVWYLRRSYTRSIVPGLILVGVLLMKVLALAIEDADDKGDDIGIGIVMVITIVIWAVIYFRSKSAAPA